MIISKIELNFFQINLMLELFMCLRLGLIEFILKLYLLGVKLKNQIFDPNVLASFLFFAFFLEFAPFFPIFSQQELPN
jgi:hypothetical protein